MQIRAPRLSRNLVNLLRSNVGDSRDFDLWTSVEDLDVPTAQEAQSNYICHELLSHILLRRDELRTIFQVSWVGMQIDLMRT